jgi:predicted enzyme related to lactoylglutathione lyase
MSGLPRALVEFPADDPDRARRFWEGLLGLNLHERTGEQGEGWQAGDEDAALGVHARGAGPGDRFALPYFAVSDLPAALERVTALGGTLIHPGERFAVCRDSEGSPFGLSADSPPA